jgi:hypothetical protein
VPNRHARSLLNCKHRSATDNRLKTTYPHRFVRKKRRTPRQPRKAARVMGKEVGLGSSDERQVCSPLMARMACPGFAIPANTAPKVPRSFFASRGIAKRSLRLAQIFRSLIVGATSSLRHRLIPRFPLL